MVRGSCLCGDVAWEAAEPLQLISHCHCSIRRESQGPRSEPQASEGGRPQEPGGERVFLPAGCLDGDPGVRPLAHSFVGSKAPWYEIHDALPRHESAAPNPPGA